MTVIITILYIATALLLLGLFYSMYEMKRRMMVMELVDLTHQVLKAAMLADIERGIDPVWRIDRLSKLHADMFKDRWMIFRPFPKANFYMLDPREWDDNNMKSILKAKKGKEEVALKLGDKVMIRERGGKRAKRGEVTFHRTKGFGVKVGPKKVVYHLDITKVELLKGGAK